MNVDPGIKALHQMQTCRLDASSQVAGKGRLKITWHDVPLPHSPDSCKGVWDNPTIDSEETWMDAEDIPHVGNGVGCSSILDSVST